MADSKKPEVVVTLDRCHDVMRLLQKEHVIACDVEGDHIKANGPITLLQIGTESHAVYIFDIQTNSDLLKKSYGLREILESKDIVKVIHSCDDVSNALFHKYKIELQNVFDPQVAHRVLEEKKGALFPPWVTLPMLNETYGGQENVFESVSKRWLYYNDYWCHRPLTEEMINYVSGEVTSLVPEVYNEQLRLLSNCGALAEFNLQVDDNLRKCCDSAYFEKCRARLYESFKNLIQKLEPMQFGQTPEQLLNILSDDDMRGIRAMKLNEQYPFDVPRWLENIKMAQIHQQLNEVETAISAGGIFEIDVDEYLKRKGLKKMTGLDMPTAVYTLARVLLNAVRVECYRRMKAARLNGERTKITHKIEVLYYFRSFPSDFQKELMLEVIAEVEAEIRTRVQLESDPDQKLARLCQFHKRFLFVALPEYLSPDILQLKESLKKDRSKHFLYE